ncbi:MarR family winged helix-turn-helix transcriptional regulator, partial [Cellulomonas septica]
MTADAPTDLGALAARVRTAIDDETAHRLTTAGHPDLRPQHRSVLGALDDDGTRATAIGRRTGQHKQVVGTSVDELEALGYVERRPDPADRRAKLVVATPRGADARRVLAAAGAAIAARHRDAVGDRI